MNVSAGAKTDIGQRSNNEDRYAVVDTHRRQMQADGVLIIADGMGGRSFGETAAEAAVEVTEESLAELLDMRHSHEVVIADALATALRKANARVYELSHADEDRKGMGTTCVAAVIAGDRIYVAHAGDSRAYLLQDGALRQITDDHSYVAEQVRSGAITEEGARTSRFRNIITRAVGIEPTLEAEVSEAEIRDGDRLLLCTDGLSNTIEEPDIARVLTQAASPQAAADKLVQMAVSGGGRDNITAVVAHFQAGSPTNPMRIGDLLPDDPDAPTALESARQTGRAKSSSPKVSVPQASRARRSVLWPVLATLFLVLGVAASGWLAQLLAHDGYRFQAAPPFAVKPPPPPPPKPLDPAHVAYDAPQIFYFMPVRGTFLTVSHLDGGITAATLSGTVITLEPDSDKIRYKFTLPFIKPTQPAPPRALGADGLTLHTATDPQGNLYVSNAVAKTVTKYLPNGEPLGLVAHSTLSNPQAIGAAADGTIYLIDAERLKVLKAHPSPTPLPPIPAPVAPKPVPPLPIAAAVPVPVPPITYARGYRRTGYRHHGYRHYSSQP